MARSVPTTSFRRASQPSADAVAAFVDLDDAPGDTPPPSVVVPIHPLLSSADTSAGIVSASMPIALEAPDAKAKPEKTLSRPSRERSARWRRKTLRRSDGRELRKQTFYLDAELSHRLMVRCAEREYDLSEAIEEAVTVWLAKKA